MRASIHAHDHLLSATEQSRSHMIHARAHVSQGLKPPFCEILFENSSESNSALQGSITTTFFAAPSAERSAATTFFAASSAEVTSETASSCDSWGVQEANYNTTQQTSHTRKWRRIQCVSLLGVPPRCMGRLFQRVQECPLLHLALVPRGLAPRVK